MQLKARVTSLMLITALVGAGGAAIAANAASDQSQAQGAQTDQRMDMNRMMQNGMHRKNGDRTPSSDGGMGGDMMNMMGACNEMMQGASAMPNLPPGNEKLQMQMHAEMMQKMGEILSSYAARLPDSQRSPR